MVVAAETEGGFDLATMRDALAAAVERGRVNAAKRGNPEHVARFEGLVDGYTDALEMLAATGAVDQDGEAAAAVGGPRRGAPWPSRPADRPDQLVGERAL
jgi:hypothetical protein